MMAITHASIAAAGTSLFLGTASPLPFGLAILGSQLPDIDTTTSTIGKIFFPISSWIEDRFPHRSITHSLKVYAEIKGFWASDRTSADGRYLIVGNEGNEFIVTDGNGVYKTGAQIITSKVTTTVGEAATTEIRNLTFNDEDATPALEELQQTYPDADIYINGELTVDFPEDIKVPSEPNQMATAALSGSKIKFEYCSLDRAIALLRGQYAIGTVEIKTIIPKV